MASVEQELWNIFTFYSLHGNPLDPEHMRAQQFVKFARECQIIGRAVGGAGRVSEPDVAVVYTAEVKRKSGTAQKMDFGDFLTALMKLSVRVYPQEARRSVDDAFQRLLMDNVLPLAGRRQPESVDVFLEDPDVQRLFVYYQDALEQIFQFYAGAAHATASAGRRAGVSPATTRRGLGGATNTMKNALGYREFLKFSSDFDLSNSVLLSTLELGDIYLSSIREIQPESRIRKVNFLEFWEALVRCALIAYSKISSATVIDKIRGLFLYMWRSINKSVPKAAGERRGMSTYAGDLISGAMLFNKRFTAQWAEDGYRDYLNPEAAREETGRTVLRRIMGKRVTQSLMDLPQSRQPADAEAAAAGGGGGGGSGAGAEPAGGAFGEAEGAAAPPPPPEGMR